MKNAFRVAMVSTLLAFAAADATAQVKRTIVSRKQVAKTSIHTDYSLTVVSPDFTRVAWPVSVGSEAWVVLDGRDCTKYQGLVPGSLAFSPDGKALFYVAVKAGGTRVLVREGEELLEFEQFMNGYPRFSPDGQRYAIVVKREGRWRLFEGPAEKAVFEEILEGSAVYEPDGQGLACLAKDGGKWYAFVGGKKSTAWEWIDPSSFRFSPDGKHHAYAAKLKGLWYLVLDGKPKGAGYAKILEGSFLFNLDGRETAFVVEEQGGQRVVRNWKPDRALFQLIDPETLSFGEKGSLAFSASLQGKAVLVLNGKAEVVEKGIVKGTLGFGPDGRTLHYQTEVDAGRAWVVGKNLVGTAPIVGRLVFSPDGKRVALATDFGERGQAMFVDCKEKKTFVNVGESQQFSPDSRRLAYTARTGAPGRPMVLVVDDAEGEEFTEILKSKEGRLFAWVSEKRLRYVANKVQDVFVVEEEIE